MPGIECGKYNFVSCILTILFDLRLLRRLMRRKKSLFLPSGVEAGLFFISLTLSYILSLGNIQINLAFHPLIRIFA